MVQFCLRAEKNYQKQSREWRVEAFRLLLGHIFVKRSHAVLMEFVKGGGVDAMSHVIFDIPPHLRWSTLSGGGVRAGERERVGGLYRHE